MPSVGTVVGRGVADGGINVGVKVGSGVDVAVGTDNCPEAQLDKAKLKSKTNIMVVRCLVFMVLLRYHGRTRRFLKVSRITFGWVIVTQQESFVIKNCPTNRHLSRQFGAGLRYGFFVYIPDGHHPLRNASSGSR